MINNKLDGSGERLKEFRKELKKTQVEFASLINSSNGHLSDMEKDRKNITDSTIELLKLKLNLNENWLRTGEGDKFNKLNDDEELSKYVGSLLGSDDKFKKELILTLLKLDQDDWSVMKKIILEMSKKIK